MRTDVYQMLAEELVECLDLKIEQATTIVYFLDTQGYIDYDNLKEAFLDAD